MNTENNITLTSLYNDQWHQTLNSFWHNGSFAHFSGIDDIRVNYAAFSQDKNKPCIVVSPGRCEGYLKYKELVFDLVNQGYQVFIIDHRGQGISQRMLANSHQGYIKNFDDYVDDLHQFIKEIVMPACSGRKPFLLAHSMGAAIATRLIQKYPNTVSASVLASPMIAINSGLLPTWFAKTLVKVSHCINGLLSKKQWYFIGQKNYQATSFEKNNLTHCPLRYQQIIETYQKYPEMQLGGVTIHWLRQAIKNQQVLFTELKQITTPVLMLQAGNDTIVDNKMQSEFCRQLHQINPLLCPNETPVHIAGAHHELFFELDQYRKPALITGLNFFKQYQ